MTAKASSHLESSTIYIVLWTRDTPGTTQFCDVCSGSCHPLQTKLQPKWRGAALSLPASCQAGPSTTALPCALQHHVGVMIANRADYAIAIAHNRKPYYPLFLTHAISNPMRILFIPVAFLLHPGTLRKLLRKDHLKRSDDSETNYHVPPESFSEVDPLCYYQRQGK